MTAEKGLRGCPQICVKLSLYSIVINDLERGMNSKVTKISAGAKLFNTAKFKADCEDLQKTFTVLGERAMEMADEIKCL